MACPTTNEAASEHSHTTAAAISAGVPIRPIGSCAITSARPSGVPPLKRCIIAVSMIPGQMAVDADVGCRVVERRRLGEADHAVFGGDVGGSAGKALDAGARGGVDDRAAALLEHQ